MISPLTEEERAIRHFMAWIPHERPLTAPLLSDPSSVALRAFAPSAHVTGQLELMHKIRQKDIIWLVRSAKTVGRPEAALDGRIVVGNVQCGTCSKEQIGMKKQESRTLIYTADTGSSWFPWKDASDMIYKCNFKSNDRISNLTIGRPLGHQLRFTRQIHDTCTECIQMFADKILSSPSIFVSYQWKSSTNIIPVLLPLLADACRC